jgi:hypothetical protein
LFYDIKGTCIQYHEVDNLNIKLFWFKHIFK